MLLSLGLKVDILWRRPKSEKGLSVTALCRLMGLGQPWEHLVPPAVARLVQDLGLLERLRLRAD